MEYLDPNEIWKYREIILSKINIVDIMTEYKIPLELKESGQFTHRAKCPFHSGKDGRIERTPSLYVSSKTNSFYCFGPCDAQGSLIDLICLMEGTSPSVALNKLLIQFGFHMEESHRLEVLHKTSELWTIKAKHEGRDDLHEVFLYEFFFALFIINGFEKIGSKSLEDSTLTGTVDTQRTLINPYVNISKPDLQ